jgi:hypothetical protein
VRRHAAQTGLTYPRLRESRSHSGWVQRSSAPPRPDGLDADAVLASHPLSHDVDPRSIDAWLATLWLYFTTSMELPVPAHSPHLRDHQLWYADASGYWLHQRLGLG